MENKGLLESVFEDITSTNDKHYKYLDCKRCGQTNLTKNRVDTVPADRGTPNRPNIESYCINCWWKVVGE